MADLSDLTVVILSYQRQSFLVRNLDYWSGRGATVIAVDGTETPVSPDILARMAQNIRYYWQPTRYEERLRSVIPLIHTKYVIQLADDEFFVPHGLQRCIDELEADDETVACVGRCLNFWATKSGITVSRRYTNWPSITQDTPQERMDAKMRTLHALTIYGVLRREVWINCIRLITEKVFTCVYVTEHAFELFSSYQGKSKVIDALSWFRSGENHPKSFKTWDRSYHFEHWYRDPSVAAEIEDMFQLLTRHAVAIRPGTDPVVVERQLRRAIEVLVTTAEAGKTRASKIKEPFRKFAEGVAASLPKAIKYPLKDLFGLTRDHFAFEQLPEKLAQARIAYEIADLDGVARSLRTFYPDRGVVSDEGSSLHGHDAGRLS